MISIFIKDNRVIEIERNDLTNKEPTETYIKATNKGTFIHFNMIYNFKNEFVIYIYRGENDIRSNLYVISGGG